MKKADITVRVISAVVSISLLLGIIYLWGKLGLFYTGMFFSLCAIVEFQKVTLSPLGGGKFFRALFVFFAILLLFAFCAQGVNPDLRLGIWGLGVTSFVTLSIWQLKNKLANQELLSVLALSLLGLLYCSLLPAIALNLLLLPEGFFWFIALLVVIFSGDTLAYLGGSLWGQRKLHDQISPQKTVEGALFGALGSVLSAGILCAWFPVDMPPVFFLAVALMGSVLAQCGDLFESLIKRVGDVKDSGKMMPGHGGVLDRIDGILFASPIFFIAATFYA